MKEILQLRYFLESRNILRTYIMGLVLREIKSYISKIYPHWTPHRNAYRVIRKLGKG